MTQVLKVCFNIWLGKWNNVSSALNAQGVSQIVQCFDDNPKNFRDWVKHIEKYCKLTCLPEARKRLIAYQSSKGAVS